MFFRAIVSFLCLFTTAYAAIIPGAVQVGKAVTRLGSGSGSGNDNDNDNGYGNVTLVATRLGNTTLATRDRPSFWGGNLWGQFCDDDNCSENCGRSVNMDNPGCLHQFRRRSIRIHGDLSHAHHMVVSPGAGCTCQVRCEKVKITGPFGNARLLPMGHWDQLCWNIASHGYDQAISFRFLGRDECARNNCNWDGTPL